MKPKALGIIGGSGLYDIDGLKNVRKQKVSTPFGAPSDVLITGEWQGRPLIFLPRHGRGHRLLPSEINYRANIYALKKLGAEFVLSVSAVGSMKEEIPPGDVVIVDQFIDRTRGYRKQTFFGEGLVAHVSVADPICSAWARKVYAAVQKKTSRVHPAGTYLCMEGPQFSTRAESQLYRSWNVDVIGMTNVPECKLAREAELCYATMALSTDYDCWRESEAAVTAEEVLAVIQKNVAMARQIVQQLAQDMSDVRNCGCASALKHSLVSDLKFVPAKTRSRLKLLIGKYV